MTKMNWDRVNMENLDARRKAEHARKGGDHPMTNRSRVRKSSRYSKKRSNSVAADLQALLKTPRSIPHKYTPCEYCGSPVKAKNIDKHLGRVHSFFNRVINALSIRKRSKIAVGHTCVNKQDGSESLKTRVKTEIVRDQPQTAVENVEGKSKIEAKTKKKTAKSKKQKGGLLADVLYSRNNEQLAEMIAIRLRKMECHVRLIQTARGEPGGANSRRITCCSRSPQAIALAEQIVDEFGGTIDLDPGNENMKRKGGIKFTVRL